MPATPERPIFTRRQILVAGAAGIGGVLAERLKLTATEKQPSLNTVINPSFEDGISTPTGWRAMSPIGSVQTWESGIAHTGNRSLSMTGPTPLPYLVKWETTDLISVQPSQTYTLSVWARSEGSFNIATGQPLTVIWYFDAAGNLLPNSGWGPAILNLATGWQFYTASRTNPQNAAFARLVIGYFSTNATDRSKVYFDDIALVGPPPPYSIYLPVIIKNASEPTQ